MARPPLGVGHVDRLEGGRREKERLRAILAAITGEMSVEEACARMGVGETRFADLRRAALEAALASLEPGIPGRPRKSSTSEADEVAKLRRERDELLISYRAEQVRTQIALVMPHLLLDRGGGKKVAARSRQAARRTSGARALGTSSGSRR
jgi:transposase-like protein